MLPVVAGERATFDLIAWYSLVTAGVSLLLVPVAGLGWVYAVVAVATAAGLVGYAMVVRSDRGRVMRYFGFTNVYLATVFLAMMVDSIVVDSPLPTTAAWLIVGSTCTLVGIAMVATVERGPGMRAPGVSPWRHGLEVSATALFAIAIVIASWVAVA
jgi:4-hydroxybenzoate polyprenyltransferase